MADTMVDIREMAKGWWLFLATGIIWFVIALVVLRFNDRSVTTVGTIIGFVFVLGALGEIVMSQVERSSGWRFVDGLLAVLFVLSAIWAFTQPKEAFWALASVLGFMLLMMGIFEIVRAMAVKEVNPLWWMGLVSGLLFIALAFWASQQLVEVKGEALLFYVGLMAMFRGISQIVFAFTIHAAAKATPTKVAKKK